MYEYTYIYILGPGPGTRAGTLANGPGTQASTYGTTDSDMTRSGQSGPTPLQNYCREPVFGHRSWGTRNKSLQKYTNPFDTPR